VRREVLDRSTYVPPGDTLLQRRTELKLAILSVQVCHQGHYVQFYVKTN